MDPFASLKNEIVKLNNIETENSYYPLLKDFISNLAKELKYNFEVNSIVVASNSSQEKKIGFPDLTIQAKRYTWQTLGLVEVKLPKDTLNDPRFENQFNRYKFSSHNIIFTNLREWELWQWDNKNKPTLIKTALFDVSSYTPGFTDTKEIVGMFTMFFYSKPLQIKSSKQLTINLARRAKLLSAQVEETLLLEEQQNEPQSFLKSLRRSFQEELIADMLPHQFANIVSETLTYSLLLAALEYQKKSSTKEFTLYSAYEYLPSNIPLLRELYQLTIKTADKHDAIKYAVEGIIEQLDHADIKSIYEKLSHHTEEEDPIIHFYEPFLAEYDRDEKNSRGVFYTPKQVVDFIVKGVDYLLKEKLDKKLGLSTDSVHLLDPATGTGTFLMSAIQHVYKDKIKFKNLGEHVFKQQFNDAVKNHILKHFYAFELMVAPYTVAHLKITLELERLGFNFESTAQDGDPDNDRVKIYLANTLDAPKHLEAYHTEGFGSYFESITSEVRAANKVKTDDPVIVIIGNPPYSVSSSNKGNWITELMETYKKDVKEERNIQPLSDDYIKFIRFAQWKIEKTGHGIVAMVTNHSFLSGLIHRGMRKELMRTFDQIYVLDLHGNKTIGEINPNGGVDENVFPIKQGVCIFFFVKSENALERNVWHSELWGSKEEKLGTLHSLPFQDVKWNKIEPEKTKNYFFIPKDEQMDQEYQSYTSIKSIFNIYGSGIKTNRDHLLTNFTMDDLFEKISILKNQQLTPSEINTKLGLEDGEYWNTKREQKKLENIDISKNIYKYYYRPFDVKHIYYQPNLIEIKRGGASKDIMKNFFQQNIGLLSCRQQVSIGFQHILVSNSMTDICGVSLKSRESTYMFPLFLYPDQINQLNTINNAVSEKLSNNINRQFIELFDRVLYPNKYQVTSNLLEKMQEQKPSLSITPEQIFYYAYAVFHCPTYRTRYAEQLKIDFPRLPLTSNPGLFYTLVKKGNELVNLHLLGENPFDKTPTVIDDQSKWNITFEIKKEAELLPDEQKFKVTKILYDDLSKRVYFNEHGYFEGIEPEVWKFYIGGYQVLDKWLKERKKHERILSSEDMIHFMKVAVSLRETIRLMKEIDGEIKEWPMK